MPPTRRVINAKNSKTEAPDRCTVGTFARSPGRAPSLYITSSRAADADTNAVGVCHDPALAGASAALRHVAPGVAQLEARIRELGADVAGGARAGVAAAAGARVDAAGGAVVAHDRAGLPAGAGRVVERLARGDGDTDGDFDRSLGHDR